MKIHISFLIICISLLNYTSSAQDWRSRYSIGDNVELKINDAMWQKCLVSENAKEGLLRVKCEEYVDQSGSYSRAGGTYIVHSSSDIRPFIQRSSFVPAFRKGEKVLGLSNGKWYNATILEQKGEGYLMHWDGLSSTYDEIIPAEKIRKSSIAKPPANTSKLYLGEYACYGTGGRLMAGMGFYLLPNGRYYDLDKKRGGTYIYNSKNATITFSGGFLSGQIGKNVKQSGFQLSNTVTAEPWR